MSRGIGLSAGNLLHLVLPAVVAIAGWDYCLPVSESETSWARSIQFIPGLFLDDACLLVGLVVALPSAIAQVAIGFRGPARDAALFLCGLAIYCALAGMFAPTPVRDGLESCRLVLGALLLLALAGSGQRTAQRALRWMLVGMTAATLVNLHFTFSSERPRIGVLPMLLGQNGPGTAMGIGVCLAAWLAMSSSTAASALFALAASAPAVFGAAISYSKIGMSGAVLGIASLIAAVIGREPGTVRRPLRTASALIVVTMVVLAVTPTGTEALGSLGTFANTKLATVTPDAVAAASSDGESSVGARLGYVVGTLEIMVAHPIGVGYSGFSAAIQETRAYQSGQVPLEMGGQDAVSTSNPHATPLYYASAGGWIGLCLCVAALLALMRCIVKGVGSFGAAGRFVALASCLAYMITFISEPTLLRSKLLIAPAGIAVALVQPSKQHAHRAKA